jgi:hypothetical protein
MATEVYMDIGAVENLSKVFKTFHDVLAAVEKVLTALSISLKISALFTFGGTAAAAAYVDKIKPNVKRMADKMTELSKDISDAIKAYRDGDYTGSRRFC